MEVLHKFEVGQEVYAIKDNKLQTGVIVSIIINISKNKIGIKQIDTTYNVRFKGSYYRILYLKESQISDTPENLLKKLKKNLKK